MIIAVTGTPGTGKTTVSQELSRLLDYQLIDVNQVADSEMVETGWDQRRHTATVDTESLVEELEQVVDNNTVLDGHLSHHYPANLVIVLRCEPKELRSRLEAKDWDSRKIEENIEAEILDVILQNAVYLRDSVIEIDTTQLSPSETAQIIKDIVENEKKTEQFAPGQTDWDMNQLGD